MIQRQGYCNPVMFIVMFGSKYFERFLRDYYLLVKLPIFLSTKSKIIPVIYEAAQETQFLNKVIQNILDFIPKWPIILLTSYYLWLILDRSMKGGSKLAEPGQLFLRGLNQAMMRLHGCDLPVPAVLHQKLLHVLLQKPLNEMLQPRVLLRYPEDLLQGLLYLAFNLEYLLVHLVEVRVVGNLVGIRTVPLLLLPVLVHRHYPVTLPQSLDILEHPIDILQALLQPLHPHILHPLMPQLQRQSSA